MEWTDGCPLQWGNSHTLEKAFHGPTPMEASKMDRWKDSALAASHTSEMKAESSMKLTDGCPLQ